MMDEAIQASQGSKGLVFYDRFSDVLDSYFLRHFEDFSAVILQRICKFSASLSLSLFMFSFCFFTLFYEARGTPSERRQLMLILTTVLRHIVESKKSEETKQFLSKVMVHFAENKSILDTDKEDNLRIHLAIIQQYLTACGDSVFGEVKSIRITHIIETYSKALEDSDKLTTQLQALKMLPLFLSQLRLLSKFDCLFCLFGSFCLWFVAATRCFARCWVCPPSMFLFLLYGFN